MNSLYFLAFFACFCGVLSHTYLAGVIVGGTETNRCIRPQIPGNTGTRVYRNSPVNDLASFPAGLLGGNMTCGWLPWADQPAASKCSVKAGDEIALQYWWEQPGDMIIDPSHIGPIMVYMAKSDDGKGDVWFKIYEDGFADGKWGCPDRLRSSANNGKVFVTVPADIEAGNYLLRGEIIALHDGNKPHGSQPYVSCVELTITGGGDANPDGVSFPGAYKESDPGLAFDIYNSYSTYPIPGPPVYKAGDPTGSSKDGSGSKGLSGGAKAAIAIVVIAVVVVAVIGGLIFLKKKKPETFDKISSPVKDTFSKITRKV